MIDERNIREKLNCWAVNKLTSWWLRRYDLCGALLWLVAANKVIMGKMFYKNAWINIVKKMSFYYWVKNSLGRFLWTKITYNRMKLHNKVFLVKHVARFTLEIPILNLGKASSPWKCYISIKRGRIGNKLKVWAQRKNVAKHNEGYEYSCADSNA